MKLSPVQLLYLLVSVLLPFHYAAPLSLLLSKSDNLTKYKRYKLKDSGDFHQWHAAISWSVAACPTLGLTLA